MRTVGRSLVIILIICAAICSFSCGEKTEQDKSTGAREQPGYTAADTLNWNLFVAYLQEHFDDFHDVTMRYHHQDHTINGIVELKMTWENGSLVSAEVLSNETGNDDLPQSLIEKMQGWRIEGLQGSAEITLPVNVKLVGLDDPRFQETAILTGEVTGEGGGRLHGAMILIKPEVAGQVYRAETNREGIFVRTLIPPGTWDLECSLEGYETESRQGVVLSAGQHRRERFVLEKKD